MKINIFEEYKGLPKDIYMLFTANVINRFGDFVAPFLTLYLSSKLEIKVQYISIIVTVCILSRIPGAILGGKMADNFGRKKSYLILQLIAGLFLLPCAFLTNAYINIGLIILSTFFNAAVRPALEALSMDIIPEEKRKIGFSLMYLGINIGVAVGPALAGFLFKVSLPLFFLVDTATSLLAVTIVGLKVKEKYVLDKKVEEEKSVREGFFKIALKNPQLIKVIFLTAGFSLAYSQAHFALPILLEEVFSGDSATRLGLIFNLNAITVLVATTWLTSKMKKNSSIRNLVYSGFFYGIGFGAYALSRNLFGFAIATVIWTMGEIVQVSNEKVYIAEHAEQRYRGQMTAVASSLKSGMYSLSILMGGWIIPIIGVRKVWIICLIIPLLISFTLLNIKERTLKVSQNA